MAKYTTNYNLEKQESNDYISIDGINGNFDIIDTQVKDAKDKADQALENKLDKIGDTKNNIVTFDEDIEDAELMSGELHNVLFGLIKKKFLNLQSNEVQHTVPAFADGVFDFYSPKKSGIYSISYAVVQISLNAPVIENGQLYVYVAGAYKGLIYKTNVNRMFFDSYNGSAWAGWNEIITKKDIISYDSLKVMTVLSIGTNLDNIIDFGVYLSLQSSDSATFLNCPYVGGGFKLKVERCTSTETAQTFRRQTIITNVTEPYMFTRVMINGVWREWREVVTESSWIDATLTSTFAIHPDANGYTVKYKKIGNQVYLKGALTPTATIPANNITTMFTLPAGYRPIGIGAFFVCQGTGMNRWLLRIHPSGIVSVDRYGTTTNIDIPSGAWLTFDVYFSVN